MKRTKSVARKYLEAREQNRAEKKREQQEQQQEIALANARALEAQKSSIYMRLANSINGSFVRYLTKCLILIQHACVVTPLIPIMVWIESGYRLLWEHKVLFPVTQCLHR